MTATPEERFEEWGESFHEQLCEAALRLLAALGAEPRFPADVAAVEALAGRVAEGNPAEPVEFKVEPPGQLPRYDAEFQFWLCPVEDGCLRVRHETGKLRSEAVVLRPDGTLGAFETIEGFGVPEAEWTEQARADFEAVEQSEREEEEARPEIERQREERHLRFRTENLLGTRAAPSQAAGGSVVSFVALYTTGVMVHYLVPRPPGDADEDPYGDALLAAAMPEIELADDQGTPYEFDGVEQADVNTPLMHASQRFTPAVPAVASRLVVSFKNASVEIELGER